MSMPRSRVKHCPFCKPFAVARKAAKVAIAKSKQVGAWLVLLVPLRWFISSN